MTKYAILAHNHHATPPPTCDLSTICGWCGGPMRPEHAHYRCTRCGARDSCCDGPY